MNTLTIPRKITKGEKLVVIPFKEYEKLLSAQKMEEVTEKNILRWTKEARLLKKAGKLSKWKDLTDLKK